MNGERLTFRQKVAMGAGALAIAWSGAIGYTGYKYGETKSEVKNNPILRTHDQLAAAKENLDHEDMALICGKGCIIIPESNPDREDALGNLQNAIDSSQQESVDSAIGKILTELKEKQNSSNQANFKEDRMSIDVVMNQIEDDPSFVNTRKEREAYKTALIVLSTVGGISLLGGAAIGAADYYYRRQLYI